MFIVGLGTAVPRSRYTQQQCYETLQGSPLFAALQPRSRALLRKVLLGANGIETRHLALESLADGLELNPNVLQARFHRHAPVLAAEAAQRALSDSGCPPGDIDALVISTCTGYVCPGLTSYVVERLGLRPDVLALDLVGQGCGAAVPNWRTAEALLAGHRAGRVLSVCVEICSAAMYLDDDPGVLISACLFSDGAGAVVLSDSVLASRRRVEWRAAVSHLSPADRDLLRFEHRDGMLRNVLTLQVPALAAQSAGQLLARILPQTGVSRGEIQTWILHAGGRDVLNALRRELDLTAEDVRWSSGVLNDYGNMSSASVYFALQRALAGGAPPGWWWLCSFGAGFSSHAALLRVD